MFGFLRRVAPTPVWNESTWNHGEYTGDCTVVKVAKNCMADFANICAKPLASRAIDHNLPLISLFLFIAGIFSNRR